MRLTTVLVVIAIVCAGLCGCRYSGAWGEQSSTLQAKTAPAQQLPTYWIVGDSTVRNGTPPRFGWGEVIAPLFDETRINVVNKAIGGRSTRNYIAQGRWQAVLDAAKPGDYVTVQFGHNDRLTFLGPKGDRGVIPGIGEEAQEVSPDPNKPDEKVVVHTYGWYLRQYINDAKAHKLNIILVTPTPRRGWNSDGTLKNDIRPWAEYMTQVAEQEKVPLLDLNAIVARHYNEMGREKVDGLLFERTDATHTNRAGAEFNAQCVAEGLRAMKDCKLKDYLTN